MARLVAVPFVDLIRRKAVDFGEFAGARLHHFFVRLADTGIVVENFSGWVGGLIRQLHIPYFAAKTARGRVMTQAGSPVERLGASHPFCDG